MGFEASRGLSKKDLGIEENIPVTFANNLEQLDQTTLKVVKVILKNSCLRKRSNLSASKRYQYLGWRGEEFSIYRQSN